MLGFAPLASAPLGDDSAGLPALYGTASGSVEIAAASAAGNAARAEAVSLVAIAGTATGAAVAAGQLAGNVQVTGNGTGDLTTRAAADRALVPGGQGAGALFTQAGVQQGFTTQGQTSGPVASQISTSGIFELSAQVDIDVVVDGAAARAIDLGGIGVGRVGTTAEVVRVRALSGTAGADTTIHANVQTALALDGQTAGGVASHAQAARVLDILCAFNAAAMVDSAAVRGIDLTGFAAAQVEANTAVDVIALFDGALRGAVATNGVTKATAIVHDAAAARTRVATAATSALKLIGVSSGNSLSPLFAQAIAEVCVEGLARADASISAATASIAGLGASATGAAPLRSVVQGAFAVTGPSEAGVDAIGQSDRSIPISGTATAVSGVGSQVTGALAVQGRATMLAPRAAIAARIVQLSGATDMRGVVSGAGKAVIDIALQTAGAVQLPALAGSVLALDAITEAVAGPVGTGASLLPLSGQSAAGAPGIVQARGTVSLTADTAGTVVSAGKARGTINVLRALSGDAGITGDAARQITLDGHAAGVVALEVQAPKGALDLSAIMTASASALVGAQGQLGFGGNAGVALDIGAGAQPDLGFAHAATAAAWLVVTAAFSIEPKVVADLEIVAGGTAQSGFGIHGTARCATLAVARSGSKLTLDFYGSGAAHALTTGAANVDLDFTRLGLGEGAIAGTTLRSITLIGDARARVDAMAAANTDVRPDLLSMASNIITLAFAGQAQLPQTVAAASSITTGQSIAGYLEARGAGIAYRAPPALRRSEPPRLGLSGRIMPTNAGRVLRG